MDALAWVTTRKRLERTLSVSSTREQMTQQTGLLQRGLELPSYRTVCQPAVGQSCAATRPGRARAHHCEEPARQVRDIHGPDRLARLIHCAIDDYAWLAPGRTLRDAPPAPPAAGPDRVYGPCAGRGNCGPAAALRGTDPNRAGPGTVSGTTRMEERNLRAGGRRRHGDCGQSLIRT
jgi:hypothetical protein